MGDIEARAYKMQIESSIEHWANCVESHGHCMMRETDILVQRISGKLLSDEQKDHIASVIGDLTEANDSLNEMMKKLVE